MLRYFYEQNRVSEEDEKYMSNIHGKKKDLSFSKSISLESAECMFKFIDSNKIKHFDSAVQLWGTKWNAGDSVVDLSNIENGEIKYRFETAWCRSDQSDNSFFSEKKLIYHPHEWLLQVSKLYFNLDFYINFSNEDDNYDITYDVKYKNGKYEELNEYSSHMQIINENGGIDKIVNDIIEYFNNNPNEVYASNEHSSRKDYLKTILYMIEKEKDKNIISYLSGSNENFNNFLNNYMLAKRLNYYGVLYHDSIQKCLIEKIKNIKDKQNTKTNDIMNSYYQVGEYQISHLCLQSIPCNHYVIINGKKSTLSGVTIYNMLKKDGLSHQHFNEYSNY